MWAQSHYRGRQRVLSSRNEVPHIFTRKSRVQPKEILIASAKRLFQQHRSKSAPTARQARVRSWRKEQTSPKRTPHTLRATSELSGLLSETQLTRDLVFG